MAGVLLPRVSAPSPAYDCDDSALAMYRHFQELGLKARPVIGNLDDTGESFSQSDHVWLLVEFFGHEVAYDWGLPRFDRQHHEGYPITLDQIYAAIAADNPGGTSLIAAAR